MIWVVRYEEKVLRQLRKLDKGVADRITGTLENRIAIHDDPTELAKAMTGKWKGLWRFRIGDYRIICDLRQAELVIVTISVGHRKDVYD